MSGANSAGAALVQRHVARGELFATPLAVAAELARRALLEPEARPAPWLSFVEPVTRQRYRLVYEAMLPIGGERRAMLVAEPVRSLDSVELLRKAGLTEREAEVALAAVRGYRSAEGADALKISEHTFLGYLKATYKKLGVGSRSELAALLLGGS
jgi:DNA-binding CsgD family transcriptional regulator